MPWFLGAALLIALNVQSMGSPLAGAWLPLMLAACWIAKGEQDKDLIWWCACAWLLAIALSIFALRTIIGSAAVAWPLAAMPLVAISLRKEHLNRALIACLAVVGVYAAGLIAQLLIHPHYTWVEFTAPWRSSLAVSWPLLDPNNAACVLNCALIPCFYKALTGQPRWWWAVALFSGALFATNSICGSVAAVLCCGIILTLWFRARWSFKEAPYILSMVLIFSSPFFDWQSWFTFHLSERPQIWAACLKLLHISPWRGIGLGTFSSYYALVRTEHTTGGYYAHNDILQFAVEMGIPVAIVFCMLIPAVALTTCRRNAVSALVLLAVLIEASFEFQFYLPSVSILAGVALAWHRHNYQFKPQKPHRSF